MSPEQLEAEIQRHLWRITELKAEIHDEQVAVAHLQVVLDQTRAEEAPASATARERGMGR